MTHTGANPLSQTETRLSAEDSAKLKALNLAIVRENLLKPEGEWRFDTLGQAAVQHSLAAVVADYERLTGTNPEAGDFWWTDDGEDGFTEAGGAYEAARDYGDDPHYPIRLTRSLNLPFVWAIWIGPEDGGAVRCFQTKEEAERAAELTPPLATGSDQ